MSKGPEVGRRLENLRNCKKGRVEGDRDVEVKRGQIT